MVEALAHWGVPVQLLITVSLAFGEFFDFWPLMPFELLALYNVLAWPQRGV
jgi:hypothetical protein